ncbi:MAG: prepilin-type N-terminal cleavage/methylation domain-containing protein [Sulfurimonas sp.]|nr:prepilin-type N-terminal cleavage/methylation domain-containing protein [Sulfurimonas sp.]
MKKAFTMLELVFVLVVIGILAAVMLPQMQSTKLREAAIQVVSHIRYTQHLAMVDDKFDAGNTDWYKERWQIIFSNTTNATPISYSIFSDKSTYTGNADPGDVAMDPMDSNRFLSGGSSSIAQNHTQVNKKMNLGETYNITAFDMTGGCNNQVRLTFDHLGRPISGPIHGVTRNASYVNINLIQTTCNIVLTSPEGSVTIEVEPETGYAHIR